MSDDFRPYAPTDGGMRVCRRDAEAIGFDNADVGEPPDDGDSYVVFMREGSKVYVASSDYDGTPALSPQNIADFIAWYREGK